MAEPGDEVTSLHGGLVLGLIRLFIGLIVADSTRVPWIFLHWVA